MKSPREIDSLVNSTQKEVDEICPGKVHVFTMRREDGIYLVGQYWNDGISEWMEKIDKYFRSNSLFLEFFKQRQKWMNAEDWERKAFKGHPAMF